MGINIIVERLPGHERASEWDWLRHAGDREFAAASYSLPIESKNEAEYPDVEWYHRPTDFNKWRSFINVSELPNKERFLQLVGILEKHQDYWIYYSY